MKRHAAALSSRLEAGGAHRRPLSETASRACLRPRASCVAGQPLINISEIQISAESFCGERTLFQALDCNPRTVDSPPREEAVRCSDAWIEWLPRAGRGHSRHGFDRSASTNFGSIPGGPGKQTRPLSQLEYPGKASLWATILVLLASNSNGITSIRPWNPLASMG